MAAEPVIRAEGLGKRYVLASGGRLDLLDEDQFELATRRRLSRFRRWSGAGPGFWALRDVSFELGRGEALGLIGANGAGKSTLLKILARITDPTEGRAELHGRAGSLLEVGTGFHPELSGRDNIFLNGAILGMKRSEIRARFDEIVEFSGIERFIEVPVKFYSSGMYVRLAFAVAAHLDPEILLVDEVLAVGDLDFQRRCLGRMDEVAHSGRTIIFVSHNLASISALCTRAIHLERGRVAAQGAVPKVLQHYVASTERRTVVDIRDRTDRQGHGPLRFTGVEVRGTAGPPIVGEDAAVDIEYESPEPLRNVTVAIAIYGGMGEVVCQCSNKVTGQEIVNAPRAGVLRCALPHLPLMPGRYSINLYAEVSGILADWIEHAAFFDVGDGDFFGSGQLPPASHGRVILEHSWTVAERMSTVAETARR